MKALPRSLQGRLLMLVLGLVALVWLGAAALTWRDVRHELAELLDGHLAQAAAVLVAQQAGELEHEVDAPTLHRYAPRVAFQVFHEGRLSLRSANASELPMLGADRSFTTGFRTVQVAGTAWRVFAARGAEDDIQVYVGEQVASRNDILLAVLRGTLWPMLVALPLLGLACWYAIYAGMRPLRRLGRMLALRQAHALAPVELTDAPSEMAPLVAALNGLFVRIAGLMESERRFTSDAAHELRTPLAAIRAQAQVALAEPDAQLRRHALEATLQGCDRAAHLVEQLLTLARLDSGAAAAFAAFDLGAVVRRVLSEVAPLALAKRQRIELDTAEGCRVAGDETLIAVLVRNLVDNAIRYSPPQAEVKLSVLRADGAVRFRIEDSGPGMDPANVQRLGERFFRVAGSGETGSGLGWSIVRRIAQVHRAAVHTGISALGGLAVELQWPASVEPPSAGSGETAVPGPGQLPRTT